MSEFCRCTKGISCRNTVASLTLALLVTVSISRKAAKAWRQKAEEADVSKDTEQALIEKDGDSAEKVPIRMDSPQKRRADSFHMKFCPAI